MMSADKQCIICSGPLKNPRFGINACRACAAFYKRVVESNKELKCKRGAGDCIQTRSKHCRFCRFTRIKEVLKKASEDPGNIISKFMNVELHQTFLNHESFYECESSTSNTPLLDRLRKGYSLMCLIRRGGELGTRTKVDDDLLIRVGNMILVPATYATFPIHAKTCKEAMKAFASYAFEDFRKLNEDCKDFLIRKAHYALNSLDSAYRSMHHFPNDQEIRTPGYTTYVRPQEIEKHFFVDCTDDIDIGKMSQKVYGCRQIRDLLKSHVKGARGYFKQVKPTDNEFVALLGLSLWSDDISIVNDNLLEMSTQYREVIMRELHEYYTQKSIIDYASRIGHLHSILVSLQYYVARLQEDFEMCRLMNLYKDYIEKNGDDFKNQNYLSSQDLRRN